MEIGKKIKELRKSRGITQKQLAEQLSVSVQAVSKWENKIALPDITLVPALAKFFGVNTDYLLDCNEESKGSKFEVKIIKPEKYEDVNKIIGLLLNSITVVVNCDNINEEISKQIRDKIADSIADVGINRIGSSTFVCFPPSCDPPSAIV